MHPPWTASHRGQHPEANPNPETPTLDPAFHPTNRRSWLRTSGAPRLPASSWTRLPPTKRGWRWPKRRRRTLCPGLERWPLASWTLVSRASASAAGAAVGAACDCRCRWGEAAGESAWPHSPAEPSVRCGARHRPAECPLRASAADPVPSIISSFGPPTPAGYEEEARYFDPGVSATRREALSTELRAAVRPAFDGQCLLLRALCLDAFRASLAAPGITAAETFVAKAHRCAAQRGVPPAPSACAAFTGGRVTGSRGTPGAAS